MSTEYEKNLEKPDQLATLSFWARKYFYTVYFYTMKLYTVTGLKRLIPFFSLFLLSACSTNSDLYLRDELANHGPVALSAKNPFLAPNFFIAKEMQHSRVFRGFINYRGTPDAVEVRKQYFKPIRVYLFYLLDGEAYLMERGSRDWIVKGPDKIPTTMMNAFLNINPAGAHAPLAPLGTEESGDSREFSENIEAQKYSDEPPPEVKSLRKVPTRSELSTRPRSKKNLAGEEDMLASKNVLESSSGDIIHRVTYPGETLRIITQWYTGDANNTGRVARINGIEKPDLLKIDQTVRIPRYMLKTTKPLPESEVKQP